MAYKYKITYQTKKWGKLIKNRLKRFNDFDEAVALCKKINKEYENVKKILIDFFKNVIVVIY